MTETAPAPTQPYATAHRVAETETQPKKPRKPEYTIGFRPSQKIADHINAQTASRGVNNTDVLRELVEAGMAAEKAQADTEAEMAQVQAFHQRQLEDCGAKLNEALAGLDAVNAQLADAKNQNTVLVEVNRRLQADVDELNARLAAASNNVDVSRLHSRLMNFGYIGGHKRLVEYLNG